ncbi:MAG: hypothetical protein V4535_03170 [Bacteroidota bacterium]
MKAFYSLAFFLLSLNFYSQSNFVKGYFIDNSGRKVECLVNNADWDSNPRELVYKLDENSKKQQADITMIKEFGSETDYIFKRFTVSIDESKTNGISDSRTLDFTTKTIFLKEIISGNANLYSYNDSGSMKFFFNSETNEIPMQLEYKRYSLSGEIHTNNNFRQQLFNKLKNNKLQQTDFDNLEYRSASLIKLFQKYNGQDSTKIKSIFKRVLALNLYVKAGYQTNSFNADSNDDFIGKFDFDNVSQVKFAVEAEIVFPSKSNDNVAGFIEFSNASFSGELTNQHGKVVMEYSSIEIPIGIKYYFGIGESSKIFVSSAAQFSHVLKSKFKMEQFYDIYGDFKGGLNFNFGLGYKYKNKFVISFNTTTDRGLIRSEGWDSQFKSTYIMAGYNFL